MEKELEYHEEEADIIFMDLIKVTQWSYKDVTEKFRNFRKSLKIH